MNLREKEVRAKREGNPNYTNISTTPSSSRSSHKNPRIVRVSRTFGGKDRHSKVCTVRGLRDRRIRLSVPTAVQLYDLQEKLGLSQPSKVVDWLLEATTDDIEKLPPLPITQIYNPNNESLSLSTSTANPQTSLSEFLASNSKNLGISHSKLGIMKMDDDESGEQENHNRNEGFGGFMAQLSAQNLFPLGHHHYQPPSFPNMPSYNPYFQWDHPNLSLSHFSGAYPLPNQGEDQSLSSNSHVYFCPTTAATTIPPFPPYLPPLENLQQNLGFSTALHLMSSPMRPFALNVSSKSSEKEN